MELSVTAQMTDISEEESSTKRSKKCHDKKSPLKFASFELQKWYIPKNKCQLTLQNWGVPPPKKILHTPLHPPKILEKVLYFCAF